MDLKIQKIVTPLGSTFLRLVNLDTGAELTFTQLDWPRIKAATDKLLAPTLN